MRKLLIFATMGVFANLSIAGNAVTVENYFACLSEEWLDDITSFVVAKDNDSAKAYVDQGRCIMLKGGIEVSILDRGGFMGSKTNFAFQGVKLWAPSEAVRRK